MAAKAPGIADAVDEQAEQFDQLRADAQASYAEAVRRVGVQSADGTLLRGEVLARWQDFVGTGEFMRTVEQKVGWLRDRMWGAIKGSPPQADDVQVAVESGLEALIVAEGNAAAERAESAWMATPAGREALRQRTGEDLSHASSGFSAQVERAIRDWQGDVMELVSSAGMGKRAQARYMALGVNGVSVALMIAVFAQTGGITGAEVGIAGGSAVLSQRVLEAVFGDDAVRRLATQAKNSLDERVEGLMGVELARFDEAIANLAADREHADRIRVAAGQVAAARHAGYEDAIAMANDRQGPPASAEQYAIASGRSALGTSSPNEQVLLNRVSAPEAEVVDAEIIHEQEQ